MARVVIIGNAGGGKSTLARVVAAVKKLPYFELDKLLWLPGWRLAPVESYEAEHARIIATEAWVIDGLGRRESIPARVARASEVILVDMPLWMHFWLAAERQIAWSKGPIEHAPGAIDEMPPTRGLFRNIWDTDRTWMPEIRTLCDNAEQRGVKVRRIADISGLDAFMQHVG